MEVHLDAETEAKLSRVAAAQGRPTDSIIQEAVERLLDYDDCEVDKGLSAAGTGELIDHDDVRRAIDRRYQE